MRWVRRFFLFFCFVAAALVIWGAIYARKHGFSESWRNAIENEFAKQGYHVEIGKITLGAFRGLVAEDVTFFEELEKRQAIAYLNDVYLDVDLSRILKKEVSVNTLDVQKARLSLPLEPENPDGRRLHIDDVSGRVVITESLIEIVKVEASLSQLDLYLKGTLIRPSIPRDDETAEETAEGERRLTKVRERCLAALDELERFEFLGDKPKLTVEFRGDVEELDALTLDARLECETFRRDGYPYEIREMSGHLLYDGLKKEAEIDEWVIQDDQGELSVSANWKEEAGLIHYELESNANLKALAEWFVDDRRLGEIVFFSPPMIKASGFIDPELLGQGDVGFPGEVMGEFHTEKLGSRGAVFDGLKFGFSFAGKKYYLRNARLDHETGIALLNLKYDPDGGDEAIQFQTEVKLDPNVFRPFYGEGTRHFLKSWRFHHTSSVYLAGSGNGSSWEPKDWSLKGVIDLRDFYLNDVSFREMEADVECGGGEQSFRNVSMVRDEGRIVAELAQHRSSEKLWHVDGVVSTVEITEGARAFSSQLAKVLTAYRFQSPPTIRLSGQLDARGKASLGSDVRRTAIEMEFESTGLAEYDFLGKTLSLSDSVGHLSVDRARVHLKALEAGVLSGQIRLEYDAKNVKSSDRPFDATVQVAGIPLESLIAMYDGENSSSGILSGTLHLSGNATQIETYNGHGNVAVIDGDLFGIPVLGPLSKAIEKVNPAQRKAGHAIVKDASATLQIENGVVKSDDFIALAPTIRVRVAGEISLLDDSLDLEAVVGTREALSRAVLTPLSELLTFSGTGTTHETVWKPKHISNLAKIPVQAAQELVTLPVQAVEEIANIPVEGLKMIGQGLFGESKAKKEAQVVESAQEEALDSESSEGSELDDEAANIPVEGLKMIGQGLFGESKAKKEAEAAAAVEQGEVLPDSEAPASISEALEVEEAPEKPKRKGLLNKLIPDLSE